MRLEHWIYTVPLRLRSLFQRRQVERELDEELQYHLERKTEEFIAQGLTPEEARYAALRAMEGLDQQKEQCRDMRRVNGVEHLLQDLRYALRMLPKSPGFTVVAVLTLALGIGANTAVFSLVNAFFLRTLPFDRPQELVHIWQTNHKLDFGNMLRVSSANFCDWRKQARSFAQLGAYYYGEKNVTTPDGPIRVPVGTVTENIPSLLGVQPILGRFFLSEEGQAGRNKSVLLAYNYWRRHFNSDPQILGKILRLNSEAHTIVGVMPESFVFPFNSAQLWIPLTLSPDDSRRGDLGELLVIGRLKPGVTTQQAQSEMATIAKRLEGAYPVANKGIGTRVVPLGQALLFFYDQFKLLFLALFVSAGCILLIVCSNLGSLLVVRAVNRSKESAVRLALGATRWRLVRLFLGESALLALAGGVFSVAMTYWILKFLSPMLPDDLYHVGEISVDGRVLGFTLAVSLLAVFFFGLAPSWLASHGNVADTLKQGGRTGPGLHSRRLNNFLVVTQVGLATILLAGALFSLHTFVALRQINPGFNPAGVLTMEIVLPQADYPNAAAANQFYQESLNRIRNLPGINSAAAVYPLPMNFELDIQFFQIEGRVPAASEEKMSATKFSATPGYFKTLQIPLLKGRSFDEQDRSDSTPVALINQFMALRNWPQEEPVGKQLLLFDEQGKSRHATIVGVVGDSKDYLMHEPQRMQIYLPQLQSPTWRRFLVTRTAADPFLVVPGARNILRTVNKNIPITNIRSMEQVVSESLRPFGFASGVLSALGIGALLLAAMGIYGVVSYVLRQRTYEIGVRMALGAPRKDIVRLILSRGLCLTAIGLGCGLTGVLAILLALHTLDLLVLLGTPALLAVVTLLASYVPARRAMRVNPIVTLRFE